MQKKKKLQLSKETLRDLSNADMKKVAGGIPASDEGDCGGQTGVSDCYTHAGGCSTWEYYGCCY